MVRCPSYGTVIPPDSAFCGKCGRRISVPARSKPLVSFDLLQTNESKISRHRTLVECEKQEREVLV